MTAADAAQRFVRQMSTRWERFRETPSQFVDMVATRVGNPAGPRHVPDSIEVVLGRAQYPLLVGTREEQLRAAAETTFVEVDTVGRFILSRERAEELRDVLGITIQQYDTLVQGTGGQSEPTGE